jgi:hypothetical protein
MALVWYADSAKGRRRSIEYELKPRRYFQRECFKASLRKEAVFGQIFPEVQVRCAMEG